MSGVDAQRSEMLRRHVAGRGITDAGVLSALATVPRESFVPAHLRRLAYEDRALPVGRGQTISQPYVVALMAESAELDSDDRLLEIGTGTGYSAAVMSLLVARVDTVERLEELAETAATRLAELGYDRVAVHLGDGTLGWTESAPYDAIVVTAGGPVVPPALTGQLADGGRLVMPVGPSSGAQRLVRVRRRGDTFTEEDLGGVAFVPLIGEQGW